VLVISAIFYVLYCIDCIWLICYNHYNLVSFDLILLSNHLKPWLILLSFLTKYLLTEVVKFSLLFLVLRSCKIIRNSLWQSAKFFFFFVCGLAVNDLTFNHQTGWYPLLAIQYCLFHHTITSWWYVWFTHWLMEPRPSWEAANCAATQEFLSILWNTKVHCRVHKSPPLVPILSQSFHPISLRYNKVIRLD
jgi:hypothetical protein